MTHGNARQKPAIAFFGLGVMGAPMVRRLLQAGFTVYVHDPIQARVEMLVADGALAYPPQEGVARSAIVITMLPEARHVQSVLAGADGILAHMRPNTVVMDMSTIPAGDCMAFASLLAQRACYFVDAPVSGGVGGAEQGTLSIMVGAENDVFARVLPLLSVLGQRVTHMGPVGMGQTAKSCNQVIGAITLQAVCEGLLLARKSGIPIEKLLSAIKGGASDSFMLEYVGNRIAAGDYDPGFRIRLELKDLDIALRAAADCKAPLPALALVDQLFKSRSAAGAGDSEGNQALMRVYELLGHIEKMPSQDT